MGNFKRVLWVVSFVQALACIPALAQEYQGYSGVFEGFSGTQAVIRTERQEMYWLVDQYTRFSNGQPSPGDWVHLEVDQYNRAVYVVIEEHVTRRRATVDHLEGPALVVRTEHGVELWNQVPTTWQIGLTSGELQPGDSIDVGVFQNGNLAYLRLDGHEPVSSPPYENGEPVDSSYPVQSPEAPPPLPDYAVPPCPEPDYMWMPGYWHWGPAGYYWVPGTWVAPPAPGLLWTPGYWALVSGIYIFHEGYWGPHVGYYGGIVYGAGYYGEGFVGARWEGGHVAYNSAAVPVNNTVIHNTYVNNTVVINNHPTTIRSAVHNSNNGQIVSFSGPGGARAIPTASELRWANETHIKPTTIQLEHIQTARANPQLKYSINHGAPSAPAAPKPMTAQQHPLGPARNGQNPGRGEFIQSRQLQGQQQRRVQPGELTTTPEAKYPQNRQSHLTERKKEKKRNEDKKEDKDHS